MMDRSSGLVHAPGQLTDLRTAVAGQAAEAPHIPFHFACFVNQETHLRSFTFELIEMTCHAMTSLFFLVVVLLSSHRAYFCLRRLAVTVEVGSMLWKKGVTTSEFGLDVKCDLSSDWSDDCPTGTLHQC